MRVETIKTEQDMLNLGATLARECPRGSIIYLQGELGAGKTTLVRGFLRELGYKGIVKSPTYTLIETYQFDALEVHHLDLYRLANPSELQALGLSDYLTKSSILLIEWPEKAANELPNPTLRCKIELLPNRDRVCSITPDPSVPA